jgi:AcrR family transcriptional regulator
MSIGTSRSIRGLRGDQRREVLLDAAEEVIAAKAGETSMNDVAAAAGVTKPVVYRIFGSKTGLQDALVERHAQLLLRELDAALAAPDSWEERARRAIAVYLDFVEQRPALLTYLRQGADSDTQQFLSRVAAIQSVIADGLARAFDLRRGRHTGTRTPEAQVWAHAAVGMVRQVGEWWLESGMRLPRDLVAAEASRVLVGGLQAVAPATGRRSQEDRSTRQT